jgi:hypothetical protein
MYDNKREYVPFEDGESEEQTVYTAVGDVECWLCDLEFMMKQSLMMRLGKAKEKSAASWEALM